MAMGAEDKAARRRRRGCGLAGARRRGGNAGAGVAVGPVSRGRRRVSRLWRPLAVVPLATLLGCTVPRSAAVERAATTPAAPTAAAPAASAAAAPAVPAAAAPAVPA